MLNSQVECTWACLAETGVAKQKMNERWRVAGGGEGRGGAEGRDA